MSPTAPVCVAVHRASPLEVVRPSSVFVDPKAERLIGFAALSFSLGPHGTQLLEKSFRIVPKVLESSTEAIHSWAFTLPQGLIRDHSSAGSVRVTALFVQCCPSPGVFVPTAIASAKEPFTPGFPTPRHVASSEFEPLVTPCSPSRLPTLSGRVAPGIRPSGLSSSRKSDGPFRVRRALLTLSVPTMSR